MDLNFINAHIQTNLLAVTAMLIKLYRVGDLNDGFYQSYDLGCTVQCILGSYGFTTEQITYALSYFGVTTCSDQILASSTHIH